MLRLFALLFLLSVASCVSVQFYTSASCSTSTPYVSMAAGTLVRPGYFVYDTGYYDLPNQRNGLVVEAGTGASLRLRFCASPSCATSSADDYSDYFYASSGCYQAYIRHPNGMETNTLKVFA